MAGEAMADVSLSIASRHQTRIGAGDRRSARAPPARITRATVDINDAHNASPKRNANSNYISTRHPHMHVSVSLETALSKETLDITKRRWWLKSQV
jgi:hypothetical protein